jgi:hypothetical protein
LPAKALDKVWQWDNDPRSHDAVFFHRQTLAKARAVHRSFVLTIPDRLVLIVLAIVAATSVAPEELQSTAALPSSYAWNSVDADVDDEIPNAERSSFGDTLFQHNRRLTVVLVRSTHVAACMTQDQISAMYMRVGTRAPPAREDRVFSYFSPLLRSRQPRPL